MKGMTKRSAKRLGLVKPILVRMASLGAALFLALTPISRATAEEMTEGTEASVEAQWVDAEVEEVDCILMWDEATGTDGTEAAFGYNGLEIEYGEDADRADDGFEVMVAPAEEDAIELPVPEELPEDGAFAGEPVEENWEATGTESQQPEPYTVEKTARVDGAACTVIVRYASDAGIPEDAELTACSLDRGSGYADSARRATDEECDIFLVSLSLISNGVNYADTYRYEVELIMEEQTEVEADMIGAMRFDGDRPAMLAAAARGSEGVKRISFHAGNA